MTENQEPAFRLAYLILGDADEAQDVTQEAFIRAYLRLEQHDGQRPFRPWLLGIIANLSRNRQRSVGRYLATLKRYWQTDPKLRSTAQIEIQTGSQHLWQAVQKLRPAAQQIVYLRFFLAMSEAETAVTLNIPVGTAKSRQHRALKQLRVIVERDFPNLRDEIL